MYVIKNIIDAPKLTLEVNLLMQELFFVGGGGGVKEKKKNQKNGP